METPEPLIETAYDPLEPSGGRARVGIPELSGLGERVTWVVGLVLAISAFTGWYSGTGEGVDVSVMGWHTGILGKLVFFIGLALIVLVVLRETGITLPAAVPESLVVIALGSAAFICVLVRAISIPDEFFFAGRGIGLWISLLAALAAIVAGLLEVSESSRRVLRLGRSGGSPQQPPGDTHHDPYRDAQDCAGQHVGGVVNPDVDAREADQRRQREERPREARDGEREHRRAREAHGRVAGREGVRRGYVYERLGLRVRERRPIAAELCLQEPGGHLSEQDRDRNAGHEPGAPPREPRQREPRREPDDAEGADERQTLEERIQRADAMLDDPALEGRIHRPRGRAVRPEAAASSSRSATADRTACR